MGRSRRPRCCWLEPPERLELFKDSSCFAAIQFPHSPVATLNVPVGDAGHAMGQDVTGNGSQPVVVVAKPSVPL